MGVSTFGLIHISITSGKGSTMGPWKPLAGSFCSYPKPKHLTLSLFSARPWFVGGLQHRSGGVAVKGRRGN